jgi:DNA-damage-inducible protein J
MLKKRPTDETSLLPNGPPRSKGARTGMIRARVAPELKAQAERVFAKIGLSSSDAIRMFYCQVAMRKGLPFEARIANATTRKALRDAEAGRNMTDYTSVDEMLESNPTGS